MRALEFGESNGYVRVFLDEGAPMVKLLQRARSAGIASEYVSKLLAAVESDTKDKSRGSSDEDASIVIPPSSLVEPLSDRELEVLRLLISELSWPEIAG